MKEGWFGKSKGVLQILWERGFIDPNDHAKYTMKGKLDDRGILMKQTSLNYMIQQCEDFVNEKSMLQHIGEKLGLVVDRSPKCTPEIAGEGVEYSWGCGKLYYRKQPMERKKGKKTFILW